MKHTKKIAIALACLGVTACTPEEVLFWTEPSIPVLEPGCDGLAKAETLPVSGETVDWRTPTFVIDDAVALVGWYGDSSGEHFVFQDDNGARWVVVGNGHSAYRHTLKEAFACS